MDFTKYAEKGNLFLDEVAKELGFPEDRKLAGRILRSTLHTLRDRLTIEQSFHLFSELPFAVKALYVDGWRYHEKPMRMKHVNEFVRETVHYDPTGHHDFQTAKDGENAVMAVLKVLGRHISKGELHDVLAVLPPELRTLWPEPA